MGLLAGKTLAEAVSAGDRHITVTPPLALGDNPAGQPIQIDDELMRVAGGKRSRLLLSRPADSAHTAATALTELNPYVASEGGGGAIAVDNTVDPPAEVTTLIAPGAVISGDEADLSSVLGEQLIRRIGPFRVNFNTGDIFNENSIELAELISGTVVLRSWTEIITEWNGASTPGDTFIVGAKGFGEADFDYTATSTSLIGGIGPSGSATRSPEDQLDPDFPPRVVRIFGGVGHLVASVSITSEGTQGAVDVYALIAEPAA